MAEHKNTEKIETLPVNFLSVRAMSEFLFDPKKKGMG